MDKPKEIIPGWEVVEQLGSGGFSTVYKIKKTSGEFYAALKVIKIPASPEEYKNYLADGYDENTISQIFEKQVKKYEEEFHLMSLLKGNSNIVSYEDHMIVQGEDGISWSIFIRMELLETLTNKCISSPPTLAETIKAGVDICRALELCARENIIHRDIKPQNIFVNRFGDYKLGDFGIARTMEHTTHATKIGTFTYIAPEVYRGEKYNADVDIYSLGLVLYWLLNERRLPFVPLPPAVPSPSDMSEAVAKRLKGETLPPPKNGSENLKNIVLKACAFNGKDRYQSATEMRMELERELYAINASSEANVGTGANTKQGTAVNATLKQGTGASVNSKQGTVVNADAKQGSAVNSDAKQGETVNSNAKHGTGASVNPKQGGNINAKQDTDVNVNPKQGETVNVYSTTSNDTAPIGLGKGDSAKKTDFSGDKTTPIASPFDLGNDTSKTEGQPISNSEASVDHSEKSNGEIQTNKPSENSDDESSIKALLPAILVVLIVIIALVAVGLLSDNKENTDEQSSPIESVAESDNGEAVSTDESEAVSNSESEAISDDKSEAVSSGESEAISYDKSEDGSTDESEAISDDKSEDGSIDESEAVSEVYEGKTYTLGTLKANLSDGVLTISGNGAMPDYENYEDTPWYNEKDEIVEIIIKDGVNSIGNEVFDNCISLTSITIPDSVKSIGNFALYGCTSLKSITIPNGVTTIGEFAFMFCNGLTEATIPNSVITIGASAFSSCTSLKKLSIGNKVTDIGSGAFKGCKALVNVTIPDSVKNLGEYAFSGCTSLESIKLSLNLTKISENTFGQCTSLNSVTIPDSVKSIDKDAFFLCKSLTSITIGNGVKSIGETAFYECTSIKSITIPDSVTSIGTEAFYGCTALESVNFGLQLNSISSRAFWECSSLKNATFKNTVGWYVTDTEGASSGKNIDVTNSSDNAMFLEDTLYYANRYWYRK